MNEQMSRRAFIGASTAVGASLYLPPRAWAVTNQSKDRDAIQVALIGVGNQGQRLMESVIRLSKHNPVHMRAVCDIWDKNRKRSSKILHAYRAYGHRGTAYIDYQELLEREADLDAVIVATPDFCHAAQTIAALEKNLHVYCEQPMSHTLEQARRMTEAARDTGKLLQIGYQRRSNPKYILAHEKLLQEAGILGRITAVDGQWNRSRMAYLEQGWPEGSAIEEARLHAYGYESMQQFRNWQWHRRLGAGPVVGLGGQQIDVYNWFLGTNPRSIMATGGTDYWTQYQCHDNVLTLYEYETPYGIVRASHRLHTSNGNRGYFEQFVGDEGLLEISESERSAVYREAWVPEQKWYPWEEKRFIEHQHKIKNQNRADENSVLDVRISSPPPREYWQYNLSASMRKPRHQAHLENFFAAIRGREPLNCPAELGYATSASVLRINSAVKAGQRIEFAPKDFVA